jgi:rubrerythrin
MTEKYSTGKKAASFATSMAKHLLNKLEIVDEETQSRRMLMCTFCEHLSGQACSICGCKVIGKGNLVKTKIPHEKCPEGRW